jgi:hypothetical protein
MRCIAIWCLLGWHTATVRAFVPMQPQQTRIQQQQQQQRQHSTTTPRKRVSSLFLSDPKFDISKPTFDLYSLRNIRGDALLRYNNLNQSEPLRINLYLVALLSLWSYPALSEAVVDQPATLPAVVVSTLAGGFAAYRFVRECSRRSRKLRKMERELNSQGLKVRLPNNPLADRPFATSAVTLRQVLPQRRVLAICGPRELLEDTLVSVRMLRRRFVQANVLVVAVPTDGSSVQDYSNMDMVEVRSINYLAETVDAPEWISYFQSLVGEDDDENNKSTLGSQLAWFGLSSSGKSFGSGVATPRWLEILGQSLLPVEILDPDDDGMMMDKSSVDEASIGKSQQLFYEALTGGSKEGIQTVFADDSSPQVQEVLDQGGRLDGWDICLADGARPAGMTISGSDVLVISDTKAYSTTIEFPSGLDDPSATLLAVQEWGRTSSDDEWKLQLHQTIPWGPDTRAGGTLRCDCRGCTALASAPARQWNFRGMID